MSRQLGDFYSDESVPVVTPAALRAFCASLPHARLKRLLHPFEGRLLSCRGASVSNGAAAEFHVAEAAAVLGGEIVVAENASLVLPDGQSVLYFAPRTRRAPLDPEAGGLQTQEVAGVVLVDRPDGDPCVPLAHVGWEPDPTGLGRRVAVLDRLWWPATAEVGSDERSREAAILLNELLPDAAAPLALLLTAAVRGEGSWGPVLAEVFRYAERRWESDPQILATLRKLARSSETAAAVAGLVALVSRPSHLPDTLTWEGRRLRLAAELRPDHEESRIAGGRAATVRRYAPLHQDGVLALAVGGGAGQFYGVSLQLAGRSLEYSREGGQGAEGLTLARRADSVRLTLQKEGDAVPSIAVGLYAADMKH